MSPVKKTTTAAPQAKSPGASGRKQRRPLQTTVIGSYPFPGWLEYASCHLEEFGGADIEELRTDAVIAAVHDQLAAGLDVITDGEQTRYDFNLSYYGRLEGLEPAPVLKASVPGPYTLSGRINPGGIYKDRWDVTETLIPIVRGELEQLVQVGCREITLDEPSMSCYAHREDTRRFVKIFADTVKPILGRCRLSTHLCFGNYKGRAVGLRRYAPLFPAFLELPVDEMHLEMASREFAEIELIREITESGIDVAVGIIDVKSYYIETPGDVAERVRLCLKYAAAETLSFAPDCGLSQTARWAARQKLANMVSGVSIMRRELGLS